MPLYTPTSFCQPQVCVVAVPRHVGGASTLSDLLGHLLCGRSAWCWTYKPHTLCHNLFICFNITTAFASYIASSPNILSICLLQFHLNLTMHRLHTENTEETRVLKIFSAKTSKMLGWCSVSSNMRVALHTVPTS